MHLSISASPFNVEQDKSLEKTNVKIDWNKFVDEDEDEGGGPSAPFCRCRLSSSLLPSLLLVIMLISRATYVPTFARP